MKSKGKHAKGGRRLSGTARGLIYLGCSLLLLAIVVLVVWKSFVKPVEVTEEVENVSSGDTETETWTAPTRTETVTQIDEETGEEIEVEVEVPYTHEEAVYNILVAGTDGGDGRTDTIMILHIDTSSNSVCLMSVPRDTLVDASWSVPKINSAYGSGGKGTDGMKALEVQLARILGFDVDGFILIDLQAFSEIVDLIGGVWFDVPCNMYYTDPSQNLYIDLTAGYQLLDGDKAIQMCRYRKYPQADLQRIAVQQAFVKALAKQCMQVVNLNKVDDIVAAVAENIVTDMDAGNLTYFATTLLKCDFENMESYTLPGEAVMINGGSYYMLYPQQVLDIVNEHFNPYDADITLDSLQIRSTKSSGSYTQTTVDGAVSSGSSSSGAAGSSDSGQTDTAAAADTSQQGDTEEEREDGGVTGDSVEEEPSQDTGAQSDAAASGQDTPADDSGSSNTGSSDGGTTGDGGYASEEGTDPSGGTGGEQVPSDAAGGQTEEPAAAGDGTASGSEAA